MDNSGLEISNATSDDWEDECDDEGGERKEGKTKERLDDCIEFAYCGILSSATQQSANDYILPLGKCELSAVHLEVLGPPPKA